MGTGRGKVTTGDNPITRAAAKRKDKKIAGHKPAVAFVDELPFDNDPFIRAKQNGGKIDITDDDLPF